MVWLAGKQGVRLGASRSVWISIKSRNDNTEYLYGLKGEAHGHATFINGNCKSPRETKGLTIQKEGSTLIVTAPPDAYRVSEIILNSNDKTIRLRTQYGCGIATTGNSEIWTTSTIFIPIPGTCVVKRLIDTMA